MPVQDGFTAHEITGVDKGSIGEELGILPGYKLVSINAERVLDVIDYEHLCAHSKLTACFLDADGEPFEADIEKDTFDPLGLSFGTGLMSPVRSCRNKCIFCFIDQMPKGGRETLHVKDDDWRLSLIMGNYVTLTNVNEAEFERMIRRRVSPLYISVHATDPQTRVNMMRNPSAALLRERLNRLCEAGLSFHCQIVLCPEINDGDMLNDTVCELYGMYPHARSVAVVPVGLTRHREGLYPLRVLTPEEAAAAIDTVERVQDRARRAHHEGFAYAADELYIRAGRELPPFESYDDFEQIENGVGLLRSFEAGFLYALDEMTPLKERTVLDCATGVLAADFLRGLFARLEEYNIELHVHPITNNFFGSSVTVSGLVCACDIIEQLGGRIPERRGGAVLLPRCMLREGDDVFLDGVRLSAVAEALNARLVPCEYADGEKFIERLFSLLGEGTICQNP